MGDFTLGCLLGQYDRTQSFDVDSVALSAFGNIEKWNLEHAGIVNKFATDVHSSDQSLRVTVNSAIGTQFLSYAYNVVDDLKARQFTEIDTHTARFWFWARIEEAVSSGGVIGFWKGNGGNDTPIAEADSLSRYELGSTSVISNGVSSYYMAAFDRIGTAVPYNFDLDDVLVQLDYFTLNPDYSFQEQAQLIKRQHRTLAGDMHTYSWDKFFAYSVPLRFLSDSHAALINWWWENQFNLAFTLDTSDSESTYICRITNGQQPIGSRIRPYDDLWQGTLRLESINNGSLVF